MINHVQPGDTGASATMNAVIDATNQASIDSTNALTISEEAKDIAQDALDHVVEQVGTVIRDDLKNPIPSLSFPFKTNYIADAAITEEKISGVVIDLSPWILGNIEQFGWTSVTYGDELFVAVGAGRISTSINGINWTPAISLNVSWRSVTYAKGMFIAVGGTGSSGANRVAKSTDGVNWTLHRAAGGDFQQEIWSSVTFGNGLFVAVAANGGFGIQRVMTSSDGENWMFRSTTESTFFGSITFGNGRFVAVGTNRIMTSSDGINWTGQTVNGTFTSVTYGNGLFVAVTSSGTNRVFTSPDALNWTMQSVTENSAWQEVTFGNGLFIAVADSGNNRIMYSFDGINWITQVAPEQNSWASVAYGYGRFIAISSSGDNRVMASDAILENFIDVKIRDAIEPVIAQMPKLYVHTVIFRLAAGNIRANAIFFFNDNITRSLLQLAQYLFNNGFTSINAPYVASGGGAIDLTITGIFSTNGTQARLGGPIITDLTSTFFDDAINSIVDYKIIKIF